MIRVATLPNGVRIATDPMDSVRSCSIGLWLGVGSRHERAPESGITHFIEHMLFKGTARRDAIALAGELDRLGGNVNAHTSQEALCLHAQCIDEKAPRALELLSEMMLESTYPEEECRRERNVILEEYKMYEDNPDELVIDLFYQTLWPGSPLGRPILGTPRAIRQFSSRSVRHYLARQFGAGRVLIALAGHFDARACRRVLDRTFGRLHRGGSAVPADGPAPRAGEGRALFRRKVAQVHFCFGGPGPHHRSPDRFTFGLMNLILGGGMSSRLFREVREKRGLAYSINSFAQRFRGSGTFAVAGATSPGTLDEVLRICRAELERICEDAVDEEELELAKEQVSDSLLMSIESTSSRMMRLAESILSLGRPLGTKEILERVTRVNRAQIRAVARKYLSGRSMTGAFIGPKGTSLKPLEGKLGMAKTRRRRA